MQMNWTKAAVAAFIVILALALFSERSEAKSQDGLYLSLGHTVFNAAQSVGEVGYRHDHWEGAIALFGHGNTRRGAIERATAVSVSRIVEPRWEFFGGENYYRIGASYVDGMPLVGDWNYRLGVGMRWEVVELEYFHYSSAGINDPNTGIDGIQLRVSLGL